MNYDFSTLSPPDFEDLTRDLLGREFGIRFEAFPEGPDDGMDGRHAVADGNVITSQGPGTSFAFALRLVSL